MPFTSLLDHLLNIKRNKMTKVLEFLKKVWLKFKLLSVTEAFLLGYPFAVLSIVALVDKGFLAVMAWVLWTVVGVLNILKK